MHTHSHVELSVELQAGAEIWATTKPEKKKKNASGVARTRRDIWCLATLRRLRLVGN